MNSDDIHHDHDIRSPWQRRRSWVFLSVGFAAALSLIFCFDVPGFIAGETDILGNYRFEEERKQARAEMTPIERVHAESFPKWLIAEANRWDTAPQNFQTLRAELADEELLKILDELNQAIHSGTILSRPEPPIIADLVAEADIEAIESGGQLEAPPEPIHMALLRRWNQRLQELKEPYYVTGSIVGTPAGPALICEFYRRLADPTVLVGESEYPTIILQRLDRTNVEEAYLGVAHEGGIALVVTDRILDMATDQVWLMLNSETSPDDEFANAYAPAIRAEAQSALGEQTMAHLAESALHRAKLLDTIESVLARRSCGNTMQFGNFGWDGLDPRDIAHLEAYAERDKIQPCPTMKFEEVDALRAASRALRAEETKVALQRLVAWLTRMIALHEARHAADELELGRLEDPETCPGCPERMQRNTRAELSAYVASFAWSDSPATALYQACSVRSGPHRRAIRFLNHVLERDCSQPPPDDFAERARQVQQDLFGIATPMELPPEFPDQLEIHRYR